MTKTLLCLGMAAISASAQSPSAGLSQRDRDFTLSYLHATRKQVLDAVDGLSEGQWKFKQADNRWSVAEVVEHLVLAEKGLFGMARKVAESAPTPVAEADKVKDEAVLKMIPSRATKVQAPEMFQPTGRFGTGAAEVEQFQQARDATLAYVRSTSDDLRGHSAKSPIGQLDCVQWMLFIAAHSERHLGQILEVKADPKFPR